MKKVIYLFVCLFMVFALLGCGHSGFVIMKKDRLEVLEKRAGVEEVEIGKAYFPIEPSDRVKEELKSKYGTPKEVDDIVVIAGKRYSFKKMYFPMNNPQKVYIEIDINTYMVITLPPKSQ